MQFLEGSPVMMLVKLLLPLMVFMFSRRNMQTKIWPSVISHSLAYFTLK